MTENKLTQERAPGGAPTMTNQAGVLVLGMHRSGTSAATRVINLMGVPLGDSEDLMGPDAANVRGYWESVKLMEMNDQVLDALGGSWSDPPELPIDWERDPRLQRLREPAKASFRANFTERQWVWKDPRNCITLPFWKTILTESTPCVLVLREPLEVWLSLARRDAFTKALSLGLWERHVRDALVNMSGLPVQIARYEDLLADPMRWGDGVRSFLEAQGIAVRPADDASVRGFIDPGVRRSESPPGGMDEDPDATPAQRELWSLVSSLVGVHATFRAPDLPAPTPGLSALFAEHRRALHVARQTARLEAELAASEELAQALRAEGAEREERIAALESDGKRLAEEIAHLNLVAEGAEQARVAAEADFDRLLNTRTFRYSAPVRSWWSRTRRFFGGTGGPRPGR